MGHEKIANASGVLRKLLSSFFTIKLYGVYFRKTPENPPYSVDGVVIIGCLLSGKES